MVIDLVEGNAHQQSILRRHMLGNWVFSSELVRLESRIKAMRENRQDCLKIYANYFSQSQLIPLGQLVFEKATELRLNHRLKTPDALHLAAALQVGCDEILTNDRLLAKAASGQIRVVDWDMLNHAIR